MNTFEKVSTFLVRLFDKGAKNVATENAEKSALEGKLYSASGIDGVLDILVQEKKDRKAREEKKAMRESLLNL